MKYNVLLESFEGPLDLLYHLIEKEKIDIYDIPISKITDQYLAHIEAMKELDLEVTSEFLVMAATLLEIKSKMLLPTQKKEKGSQQEMEELDPRVELINRLVEYKKYKNASLELQEKGKVYAKIYYKHKEEIQYNESDIALENLNIEDLVNQYKNILKKGIKLESEINYHEIEKEEITIEESIENVLNIITYKKNVLFEELFEDKSTKYVIIITFLAVLELIKKKIITIKQEENFSDIILELK